MKLFFKARWLIVLALIISAVNLAVFFGDCQCLAKSSPGDGYFDISGMKIAAGYPMQPAASMGAPHSGISPSGMSPSGTSPSGNGSLDSSASPSGSPSSSPASSPDNNELPLKSNKIEQAEAVGKGNMLEKTGQTSRIGAPAENKDERKTAQVTIEYDVSLAPISSQPGLSVVRAMNEALMNSPRAAAVRAQFAIVRANYGYATQAPNPIVFMDRGMVAEQVFRLGPTLTIEPPWKLIFRLLATKRLVEQTKIDLLTALWSLRTDVRKAYVEVVVAQETLKTLIELYDLSSKLLAVASKRFHAGDVPELDFLKARLANSQNEVELGVGKKRVLRSYQQLDVIMGRGVNDLVNVPGLPGFTGQSAAFHLTGEKSDILPDFDKSIPPLQEFIDLAFEHRLEIKSLNAQMRVNAANLRLAYGNVIPNAMLTFGKSSAGNPPTGPKLSATFFTLNAEVPFGNWHQGDIFTYKATAKQLHYQMGSLRNQVTSEITGAYQNLIAQREKIRAYQDHVLADSYEVARLARRSYEVGQSDITSTLQAQQANVAIRSQYLDAVMSYSLAFTDLEQACGKPLQ